MECIVYDADKGIPAELKGGTAAAAPCEWVSAPAPVLAKCTGTTTPPPVFAVVSKPTYNSEKLFNEQALVIVLDGVSDPGNVGTIIRSADAVGADAVVLGKNCADVYNPKTVRSTMGSLFHLPVIEADLGQLLPEAKQHGIRLTGTSLQANHSCYGCDWTKATWLVMATNPKAFCRG